MQIPGLALMAGDRPPCSRSIGSSDEYSTDDVPESVVEVAVKSVYVWECGNDHMNYTLFREFRNQRVSCSNCSDSYTI